MRESTASLRVAYEGVVAQLETRKKRMQESDEEIAGVYIIMFGVNYVQSACAVEKMYCERVYAGEVQRDRMV
jgi:hypothetical protein